MPITPKKVKVANGEWIVTDRMVPQLQCYCQGQTFAVDMVVLDMNPYDAILGFDWLQAHSPMECDWKNKTIKFSEKGRMVQLQGLQDPPLQLSAILAQKAYNAAKGNDVWAFVLLDHVPPPSLTPTADTTLPPDITKLL